VSRTVITLLVVFALLWLLTRPSEADARQHDSGGATSHADSDREVHGELLIEGGPSNESDWVSWDGRWPSRGSSQPPLVSA